MLSGQYEYFEVLILRVNIYHVCIWSIYTHARTHIFMDSVWSVLIWIFVFEVEESEDLRVHTMIKNTSPPLDSLITALVYQTFIENTLCFTRLYPQGIFFFFLIQFNKNALALWGQWFSLPLTPMSLLLLAPSSLLSLYLQPESILLCGWLLRFIFSVFYFE